VATVEEITDPYVAAFTPPPAAGTGVCDICHNAPSQGFKRCWSCAQTTATVTHPVELVVPISFYRLGAQLYTVLSSYKRSPDAAVRAQLATIVAATLSRFVAAHGDHIRETAGDDWDILTIVPSKDTGDGPHALATAIGLSGRLRKRFEPLLEPLEPETISRANASDSGYRAARDLHGERVLLVDDTFTSGATLQSAASALALGGAKVIAGLVIGRVIHPGFSPEMGELWAKQSALPFDFDVCCLEA